LIRSVCSIDVLVIKLTTTAMKCRRSYFTAVLFTEWLLCIDADTKIANRKILMFDSDNCTARLEILLVLKTSKLIFRLPQHHFDSPTASTRD